LSQKTIKTCLSNSRFYILIFSVLVSLFVLCLLRVQIVGNQLLYIRVEQVYGFVAVAYLYLALIIAPVARVAGKRGWAANLVFARRAIGVSAAYFAVLHAAVALWGQLGGFGGLALLPREFVWSVTFGVIGLVVLLLMAATSFDKVIKYMTFRKWKWLHRLVYAACVLIILHVWMIGTHVAYEWVRLATFVPLSLLFGLEAWTIMSKLAARHALLKSKDYFWMLVVCMWLLLSLALLLLPGLVQNYHSEHHAGHNHHSGGHHE